MTSDGTAAQSDPAASQEVTCVIVGTGFSGLGAAIALRRAGVRDLVILERAAGVGGTWRDNTYPGCRCDVQSSLYSFSFAPRPGWSETFPSQPELRAYLQDVTARYELEPDIRFGHEVTAARWDDAARRWQVATTRGAFTARYLIWGGGFLAEPAAPDLPGLESFQGTVMHSAQWQADWDPAGRRVAVIGTGASAIQIVPVIAPDVAHLTLFQRTAPYVVPHQNRPVRPWERRLYRHVPAAQAAARMVTYWQRELLAVGFVRRPALLQRAEARWRQHMEAAIADPELRRQLTPDYRMGCKRIMPSDDFYPALARDNVSLVTDKITEVAPDGVVTADGTRHEADTIVLATGFRVTDNPMHERVAGRGGATLASVTGQTYLGTAVPGFPGFFQMIGANTGLGHSSMVYMIESQLAFITGAIRAAEAAGGAALEVRPDVAAAYNARLQRRLPGTVWGTGCSSWYLDQAGRNLTLWPGFTFQFRRQTRRFRPAEFIPAPPA